MDENEIVQSALRRLPDKVIFDRSFRIKRAIHVSAVNDYLPEEDWTTPEQVI